jgi:hypothetical protein
VLRARNELTKVIIDESMGSLRGLGGMVKFGNLWACKSGEVHTDNVFWTSYKRILKKNLFWPWIWCKNGKNEQKNCKKEQK